MIFKIIWDKKAENDLKKLDLLVARRIILKIKELTEKKIKDILMERDFSEDRINSALDKLGVVKKELGQKKLF